MFGFAKTSNTEKIYSKLITSWDGIFFERRQRRLRLLTVYNLKCLEKRSCYITQSAGAVEYTDCTSAVG